MPDVDIMSGSNRNVTNCKGHCAHYRRDDEAGIEYCHMDKRAIHNGYAGGFCPDLTKEKDPTEAES